MNTLDSDAMQIVISAAASAATTFIAMLKWFYSTVQSLNTRIDELSATIASLDKNLSIQSALFEQHFELDKIGGIHGNRRNQKTD